MRSPSFLRLACATCIVAIIVNGFDLVQVSSDSMQNAIFEDDWLLVNRIGWWIQKIVGRSGATTRGQVVIFQASNQASLLVKRILGVGGDRIRILRGKLMINGSEVKEPYVRHGPNRLMQSWPVDAQTSGMRDVTVPEGHYFVLGDNRDVSLDSRILGAVPEENMIGTVIWVFHHKQIPEYRK